MLSTLTCEAGHMTDKPYPDPVQRGVAHERLSVFIGTWHAEGESYAAGHTTNDPRGSVEQWVSDETYAWLPIHDAAKSDVGETSRDLARCVGRCASTGHGGIENRTVFPVSRPGQRNGSRALVPPAPTYPERRKNQCQSKPAMPRNAARHTII